jgi:hypothetical protein
MQLSFVWINIMDGSPCWEVYIRSASQKMSYLVWNRKVHYRFQKTSPLLPVLSQMSPIQNFSMYFSKIHSNIVLPSTARYSTLTLHIFWQEAFMYLSLLFVLHSPAHLILLDLITLVLGLYICQLLDSGGISDSHCGCNSTLNHRFSVWLLATSQGVGCHMWLLSISCHLHICSRNTWK